MNKSNKEELPELPEILHLLADSPEDVQAWEYLYRRTQPWVFAVLYRLLRGQRELTEDASQEVFIRLLRYARFNELRQVSAFKNYVYVVCQNVGKDYWSNVFDLAESPFDEDEETVQKKPERYVNEALLSVQINEILSTLEAEDRQLMTMILQGFSLDEVAQNLGLSYSNAAVRLHRIRKGLKDFS